MGLQTSSVKKSRLSDFFVSYIFDSGMDLPEPRVVFFDIGWCEHRQQLLQMLTALLTVNQPGKNNHFILNFVSNVTDIAPAYQTPGILIICDILTIPGVW